MIFEELITQNKQQFLKAVNDTAKYLGVNPDHLMFVMWFETNKTFRPDIQNSVSKATGLIQFMPKTAIFLGTSVDLLKEMTNYEQMEYVKKHLGIFRGKYRDWLDLYCAIFWPAAVGKSDDFKITSDIVAKQNPIFDINKDLDIDKSEIRAVLYKQIPLKYRSIIN